MHAFPALAAVFLALRHFGESAAVSSPTTTLNFATLNSVILNSATFALATIWILLFGLLVAAFLRAQALRRNGPPAGQRTLAEAKGTHLGLLGQAIGFLLAWNPLLPTSLAANTVGLLLALFGAAVVLAGALALGRYLRAAALLTQDHQILQHGPFALVRHPMYAGLLWLTLGTALVRAPLPLLLLAMLFFLAGTELRVRVEDRLLLRAFPQEAAEYQRRVAAYLPWLR